ncbi:endonuclease domain-containing protein [Streptomyces sp. NPDC017993]|uniref:endonuclease domain-containing protein n=1 Tax=Streptomyces sp. NPDC017993 TaxID=3365027 RepID=UPI0037B344C6
MPRTSCGPLCRRAASSRSVVRMRHRQCFRDFSEHCPPRPERAGGSCGRRCSCGRCPAALVVRQHSASVSAVRGRGPGSGTHVDHAHETGKVRGVRCFSCNAALDQVKDRPDVVRRAAEYLEGNVWKPTLVAPGVCRRPS